MEYDEQGMILVNCNYVSILEFLLGYSLISIYLILWMAGFHVIQKMINGMTVSRWACINFSRSVQESVARGFCGELAQMCQVSGMVNVYHTAILCTYLRVSHF